MPTKRKPPAPSTMSSTDLPDAFQRHIQTVLERFHQTEWLGEHSPLSAPYFLGQRPAVQTSATQRGQTLQRVLRQANDSLKTLGPEAQSNSRLIELAYLKAAPLTADGVAAELNLSRATYYRRREQAIQYLAAAFVRQINPALRLDRPPHPDRLIGRDEVRESCRRALQQGRTVGLSGPAGIGKTTVGAALATTEPFAPRLGAPRRVFWYTFIPGLNDQLGSVLFSLGFFLWQQGAANLWAQLIAEPGRINPALLSGLLREDLKTLSEAPPLLCFDEVDLLRTAEVEAHRQVAAFLGSLRGLPGCACLFIGQRPVIEVDEHYTLEGLNEAAVQQYFSAAGIEVSSADQQTLLIQTDGNPRLLDLIVALQRSGEAIDEVLSRLPASPSIEFLLKRIRQHLNADEQTLLDQLAAFRRPAPADAFPAAVCTRLVEHRLTQRDAQGGLVLQPALRTVLYEKLRPEARRSAHFAAAAIRAARADYTAAAYHYVRADEIRWAIWLWQAHRTEEINQGQGPVALALFEQVDDRSLAADDRDALALILAELRKLIGLDPRADLQQHEWHTPLFEAQAKRLEGDLAELKGQIDAAIAAYQDGLNTIENLLAEQSLFDKNLGWTYLSQGGASLDLAWQKACLARFEAERLQGDIQAHRGEMAAAERHYTQALALAQSFNHREGEAKTHNHLATLLAKEGRLDEAREHRQQAIALFQQLGNQVHLAGAKLNMAFDHNLIGQQRAVMPPADENVRPIFAQVVQAASEARELFERLGQSLGCIIAAQNLAEAYLYLGDLATAEQYAQQVIQSNATHVLPDGLRTLGEIKLAQGDLAAETFIRQSIEAAEENDDRYLQAYGWRALARVQWTRGKREQGQAALGRAVELFESLGLDQEVTRSQSMPAQFLAGSSK
jgi:tetratricopeptide (TPR) repeat protein